MREELERVLREVRKVIAGKDEVIGKILKAMLAKGHILLDDVPGVGKTTLAVALGRAADLSWGRIQFTPDVLPSDIVGFSVYDRESGALSYRPGVLNGVNILLGDEINRASSRTQSALLEAMEERQVTVDGHTYPLAQPFVVIATQNSVGAAGTQRLPYAQVDRFLVRLTVGYPDHEAEMTMLRERQTGDPMDAVQRVLGREDLLRMQREAQQGTAKDVVLDYVSRLAEASRTDRELEVGISPRGALYLCRMAKAEAWADGRDYATGRDVQAVFHDVCLHRVLLSGRASLAGATAGGVLDRLLKDVPVPDGRA